MSLVDLISADVSLTKRGKDYWGLCPWHPEKNPSFSVSSDKGLWYCFSCLRGGDSIQFLRDYRGLSYQEACTVVGKELQPDPYRARRKQIKDTLEWEYWTWRRQQWSDLLAEEQLLPLKIRIAEAAYRAMLRTPEQYTDDEQTNIIDNVAALYHRRDVVNQDLNLLQSTRDEETVQQWWSTACG